MTEQQKKLVAIAYDMESASNRLKKTLILKYNGGGGVEAQSVAMCTELHNKAVELQKIAEGME